MADYSTPPSILAFHAELVAEKTEQVIEAQKAVQAALSEIQVNAAERARRGFSGKRVYIELMDGKHDGLILDSESGDPTERELVKFLRFSDSFELIEVVETDTEAFVQLRPKAKS